MIRGNKEPNLPQMAYVDEEIPEEPIMVFPDPHLHSSEPQRLAQEQSPCNCYRRCHGGGNLYNPKRNSFS